MNEGFRHLCESVIKESWMNNALQAYIRDTNSVFIRYAIDMDLGAIYAMLKDTDDIIYDALMIQGRSYDDSVCEKYLRVTEPQALDMFYTMRSGCF